MKRDVGGGGEGDVHSLMSVDNVVYNSIQHLASRSLISASAILQHSHKELSSLFLCLG